MLPGVLAIVEERDKAPSLLIQLAHRSKAVSGVHVHSYCFKSNIIYIITFTYTLKNKIFASAFVSIVKLTIVSNRLLNYFKDKFK